jgi:hypothetical protein
MDGLEGTRSEAESAASLSDEPDRPLRCFACSHAVTTTACAIDVDGSHVHTRLNPANVVFQFGCFREVSGCVVNGTPSSEHVWFKGCLWQYAHCAKCGAHLGWAFSGALSFFGLVLARLTGP